MKTRLLAPTLFSLALLAACNNAPSPPTPPAAPDAPQTMIGRAAGKAIDEARKELATSNLALGRDGGIRINGNGIGEGDQPNAEITPQGDFLIEGKSVAVNDAQRALLLDYRRDVHAVVGTAMTLGIKGADLAGTAMKEAIGGIFSGDGAQIEQRIEAEASKLENESKQICTQLPALLATQEKLAAVLPEFQPYATLNQKDVDECNARGSSAFSNDGQMVQGEIRDGIRRSIRTAVQGATMATGASSTASVDGVRFVLPAGTLSVETVDGVSTLDTGGSLKVKLEGDSMYVNGTRHPRPVKGSEVDLRDAATVKVNGKAITAK